MRGDYMDLMKKQITVQELSQIVYLQVLEIERLRNYCEKTYLKQADFDSKADKSEVLFYRRPDGNISLKEN